MHPGDRARVIEADAQMGRELDGAADADDAAHDVDASPVDGQEVVHLGDAARALPPGDEHEGVAVVVPARDGIRILRSQMPRALLVLAEDRAEDGCGVEPRCAEPVDAALARDQGSGAAVAEDGVLLDRDAHAPIMPRRRAFAASGAATHSGD
jgi:hypothetical protein